MNKYYANSNNLRQIIDEYGFAIIPNILDQNECQNMINNMWDSRTIHYGSGHLKYRTKPNTRCISYLCYAPKSFIDQDNLINKKIALINQYTTNHDPCFIRFTPLKI